MSQLIQISMQQDNNDTVEWDTCSSKSSQITCLSDDEDEQTVRQNVLPNIYVERKVPINSKPLTMEEVKLTEVLQSKKQDSIQACKKTDEIDPKNDEKKGENLLKS